MAVCVVAVTTSCGADEPAADRAVEVTTSGTTQPSVTPSTTIGVDDRGQPTTSTAGGTASSLPWRKVSAEVVMLLDSDGSVPVLISLDADDDPERIAAVQEQVLELVDEVDLRLRVAFDRIPAIAAVVSSTEALAALEREPGVVTVAVDGGGTGDGGGGG